MPIVPFVPGPEGRSAYDHRDPRAAASRAIERHPERPVAAARDRRIKSAILGVVLVAIVGAVGLLVASPYVVVKTSMEPGLEPGEVLLVDRLSPEILGYARGDVVVFWSPVDQQALVKRIVGLPLEDVVVDPSGVWIDGRELHEPYLAGAVAAPDNMTHLVVPADAFFVLGDNRVVSLDSRAFGPISADRLIGRAWAAYAPPVGLVTLPATRATAYEFER